MDINIREFLADSGILIKSSFAEGLQQGFNEIISNAKYNQYENDIEKAGNEPGTDRLGNRLWAKQSLAGFAGRSACPALLAAAFVSS